MFMFLIVPHTPCAVQLVSWRPRSERASVTRPTPLLLSTSKWTSIFMTASNCACKCIGLTSTSGEYQCFVIKYNPTPSIPHYYSNSSPLSCINPPYSQPTSRPLFRKWMSTFRKALSFDCKCIGLTLIWIYSSWVIKQCSLSSAVY